MKKILAFTLAILMVLSLAACGTSGQTQTTASTTDGTTTADTTKAALMKFTVTVVHADGTSKDFTYETDQKFVGPVLEGAGLIKGNAGPYGMEITHVDGEKAVYTEDNAYWAVYEGEEYALQGIDTTPVKDGGVYKLVYTGA